MASQDDMMIANGMVEEIVCTGWVSQTNNLLRTTEVGLCLVPNQFPLFDKAA